jgi:HNH endonuclease
LDGAFPDGAEFKLSGLQVYPELDGMTCRDLGDDLQDAVRYFKLRTVTFKRGSSENLKFEIFERLNTGSVPLNDQELRNCIYRGPYNDLIHDLSRDPDFVYLLDLARPDKRRKDVELVLRYCAFYNATYLKFKPPMKAFLNKEASSRRNLSPEEAKALRVAFKNACQITRSMFGKNAFKRYYRGTDKDHAGYWEPKKFNASLFDVVMYIFSLEDKNTIYQNMDSIREALIVLMTENEEFIDAIELSTSSLQAVTKRFDLWRSTLQSIIGIGKKEPRCFTIQLKEALCAKDSTCAICNQRIVGVDDAAVDHIEQYWTGGKTIPENARLTHRYCNWARPRKE